MHKLYTNTYFTSNSFHDSGRLAISPKSQLSPIVSEKVQYGTGWQKYGQLYIKKVSLYFCLLPNANYISNFFLCPTQRNEVNIKDHIINFPFLHSLLKYLAKYSTNSGQWAFLQ